MHLMKPFLVLIVLSVCAWNVANAAAEEALPEADSDQGLAALPDTAAPPEAVVAFLQEVLLRNMMAGGEVPYDRRYELLTPVISRVFDTERMAFFLFGRRWSTLEEPARRRFVDWFERLTIATYARRFASFSGQTFETPDAAPSGDRRARVTSRLTRPDKDAVDFVYLMGSRDDRGWQIINVVANGVSDLAIRRSQYARLYDSAGLDAVIEDLQAELEQLRSE